MSTKPYRFPTPRKRHDPLPTAKAQLDGGKVREVLTHQVQGQKASDLEERYARALEKNNIGFTFQFVHGAPKGMPGWQSLDFLIYHNGHYPDQVDNTTFIHRSSGAHDRIVDIRTEVNLKKMGYNPFPVTHVTEKDLSNQDDADRYVKNRFG